MGEELVEGVRCRHGVVMQQPEPAGLGRLLASSGCVRPGVYGGGADSAARRHVLRQRRLDGHAKAAGAPPLLADLPTVDRIQGALVQGTQEQHRRLVGAVVVDRDQAVGPTTQRRQTRQRLREPPLPVQGYQDRGHPRPRDIHRRAGGFLTSVEPCPGIHLVHPVGGA